MELTIALLNQILRVGNDHALVTHCHELIQIIIQNICNQDFQGSLIQLEIPYSSKTKGPTQKASQLIKIQSEKEFAFIRHRLIHILHGIFLVPCGYGNYENIVSLLSIEKDTDYQWVT